MNYSKCGVFTTKRDFAEIMINIIIYDKEQVSRCIKTKDEIRVIMKDGSSIQWINPNTTARGFRLSKISIDLATCTKENIERTILPFARFESDDRFSFFDSEFDGHKQYDLDTLIDRLTKYRTIFGNVKMQSESYDDSLPVNSIDYDSWSNMITICGSDFAQ